MKNLIYIKIKKKNFKLSLNKETISKFQQKDVKGGATPIFSFASCQNTNQNCCTHDTCATEGGTGGICSVEICTGECTTGPICK